MAAGNVIALLYERFAEDTANYHTYDESSDEDIEDELLTESNEMEEDEGSVKSIGAEDSDDEEFEIAEKPKTSVQSVRPQPLRTPSSQPTLYYDEDQLIYALTNLATSSTKRIAKSSRKVQHSVFRDILETVKAAIRNPDDDEDDFMGYEDPSMGSTVASSISKAHINRKLKFEGLVLSIESWAAYVRLIHIKHILSIGLPVHYSHNRIIRVALDPQGSSTYEKIDKPKLKLVPSGNEDLDGNNEFDLDPTEKGRTLARNVLSRRSREANIKKARNNRDRQRLESELVEWAPPGTIEDNIVDE